MSCRLLSIYLQDHLAGATAGVALAKRAAESNAGTSAGPVLAQVATEVEADRKTLERLMSELGVQASRSKNAAAWMMERLERLKPSGRMRSGKAYHRLHELETLSLGIAGKLSLWEALRTAPEVQAHADLDDLEDRARSQRERIEVERIALARAAFGPDTSRHARLDSGSAGKERT